jgi:hypothetical protein
VARWSRVELYLAHAIPGEIRYEEGQAVNEGGTLVILK